MDEGDPIDETDHGAAYRLGYLAAAYLPRPLLLAGSGVAVAGALFRQRWSVVPVGACVALALLAYGAGKVMDHELLRGLSAGTRTLVWGIVSVGAGAALALATLLYALLA
jgi:hypothetical protein